jgi:hypothetical protein
MFDNKTPFMIFQLLVLVGLVVQNMYEGMTRRKNNNNNDDETDFIKWML